MNRILLILSGLFISVVVVVGSAQSRNEQIAESKPAPAPTEAPKPREWYVAKLNNDACMRSRAPADTIRMIQESGFKATTRDFTNSSGDLYKVEVSYVDVDVATTYTYFGSEKDCLASLPVNQPIAARYQ